jgi:hypothetical protein
VSTILWIDPQVVTVGMNPSSEIFREDRSTVFGLMLSDT